MKILRFELWCRRAVSGIFLPQDKIRVGRELMSHMQDLYDSFLDRGMSEEEAEFAALEAMGDPEDIAAQLGAIHRPFWGLLHQRTRKILVVFLCVTLALAFLRFTAGYFFVDGYSSPMYYRYDPYEDTRLVDGAGISERLFYTRSQSTDRSDGYTFTLTQAALWQTRYMDSEAREQSQDILHLQIEATNIRPWAAYDNVLRWFWAEDSLGNVYHATYDPNHDSGLTVQSTMYHPGPMSRLYEITLTDCVSRDAQWIVFHYDRAGRDVALYLDLTGGEEE